MCRECLRRYFSLDWDCSILNYGRGMLRSVRDWLLKLYHAEGPGEIASHTSPFSPCKYDLLYRESHYSWQNSQPYRGSPFSWGGPIFLSPHDTGKCHLFIANNDVTFRARMIPLWYLPWPPTVVQLSLTPVRAAETCSTVLNTSTLADSLWFIILIQVNWCSVY